jgi:acetyltransferase
MSSLAFRSERANERRAFAETHAAQTWRCHDGQAIMLRRARAGDVADLELVRQFFANLSPRSRYQRFFSARSLSRAELEYLTCADRHRQMALFATVAGVYGGEIQVGAAHYVKDPHDGAVEVAVVVADQWQRLGLGEALLSRLMDCAGAIGAPRCKGLTLATNAPMLNLARKLGGHVNYDPNDPTTVQFSIPLR